MAQSKLKEESALDEGFKDINQAIPAEAHTPMYNVHRYFARKAHNVVRAYIDNYSKEGEIVLDPFCGSGVTIAESLKAKRRAIGIDLDPMATFITRMTSKSVDLSQFEKAFENISETLKDKINSFYITECRKCGKKVPAIMFVWNKGKPVKVGYACPNEDNKRVRKDVNEDDVKLLKKIEAMRLPPHPTRKLYYKDGLPFKEKQKYETVDGIFTRRNLLGLSLLHREIDKIEDPNIKDFMNYSLTSISHLASRMTPDRPSRPFSSFWGQHSYWYATKFMESNVWDLFQGRINDKQGVIRGKEESNKEIPNYKEGKNFDDLKSLKSNVLILNESCIDALRKFPSESMHYIFTDPPYGGSIQYAELTFMWSCWLGFDSNFDRRIKDEIIINHSQKKGFEEYYNAIFAAFKEIFRVLKTGRYMTLTFHNPDIKIRNAIIRACVLAGFDCEKILFQPPARLGAKGLLQPFGSLQGDYFLRFKKPFTLATVTDEEITHSRYSEIITEIAEKIIAERGEPTQYTFIQNAIDPILYRELRKHGLLLQHKPENVRKILEEQIGKRFVLIDAKIGTLEGKSWWLKDPANFKVDIIPLNKRVEETTINFLKSKFKASYTEILSELFTNFKNSLTPDTESVRAILNRIADQTTGNMWTLKPFVEVAIKQHEEIVYYLGTIGQKAGFDVHLASDEYSKRYEGKQLREYFEPKDLRLPLEIPAWNLRRINRIDVLWYKEMEKKIYYSFDVENSTNITDSIMRGSNIPETDVQRLIVIPEEYETLMNRVFNEPAINEIVEREKWKVITFENLRSYFNSIKHDSKISDLAEFTKLARTPREQIKKQTTLGEFNV